MVKGISRQVIVMQSPDPKLFEQAIFILKEDAIGQDGVTEEALLKEANRLINNHRAQKRKYPYLSDCGGNNRCRSLFLYCRGSCCIVFFACFGSDQENLSCSISAIFVFIKENCICC